MKKVSLVLTACSLAVAAQAQLIDNFGIGGLGEYTKTVVLDNGIAESNVSFSDSSGRLTASYTGSPNAAEQVVLLRNDFNLGVGSMLMVDVLFPTQTSEMDFGIAVSATATPNGAVVGTTDTRGSFNWAAVYVRPNQNAVRSTSSIGGTVTTGTGVLSADETTVAHLFIERNSTTDFTLGYFSTLGTRVVSRTVTFGASDVGTALGFYGDLRTAGGTLGELDNLRIAAIPEPGSLSLLALSGVGALVARRRISRK